MKKTKFLLLALCASLLLPGAVLAGGLKIGYANLQRALNECDAGVKAVSDLKREAAKLEKELNARQEGLKKIKDEIEKKRKVWNKDTLAAREAEFDRSVKEYERFYNESGNRLNRKQQQREAEIISDLREVVREVAKKKGYSFVFEYSIGGVLYAPDKVDLTDEVIKAYNAKQGKGDG